MKIIFPYIDKKTNKTKTMLYFKKKKKKNIQNTTTGFLCTDLLKRYFFRKFGHMAK